jgi:hypothetical protein
MGPGGLTASVRLFCSQQFHPSHPGCCIPVEPARDCRAFARRARCHLDTAPNGCRQCRSLHVLACLCLWETGAVLRIAGIELLLSKVALGDALSRCRHWGRELSLIRKPGSFCRSSIVEAIHWRRRCTIGRLAAASGSREGGVGPPLGGRTGIRENGDPVPDIGGQRGDRFERS